MKKAKQCERIIDLLLGVGKLDHKVTLTIARKIVKHTTGLESCIHKQARVKVRNCTTGKVVKRAESDRVYEGKSWLPAIEKMLEELA